jgi:Protein of unknown function (DUF3667)
VNCLNCDAALTGDFCASCGQAANAGRSPTLRHFASHVVHEFSPVDGKTLRTLRQLLFAPGFLTAEYWGGRLRQWVRPLRIFVVVVAVNLLLVRDSVGPMNFRVGVFENASGSRVVQVNPTLRTPPGFTAVPEAESRVVLDRFRTTYASIRYVSVVLFALGMWGLYRRLQPFYVNHLVAGLHFYSVWYLIAAVGARFDVVRLVAQAGVFSYLVLMLHRLFPASWWKTGGRGVLLLSWLVAIEILLGIVAALVAQRSAVP